MSSSFSSRDLDSRELMDDPQCDQRMLERTYRRFGPVNALVSRPGAIYRRDIRPRAIGRRSLRILDVGAGGGDLCRLIARRLRKDGLDAEITALDADERAIRWASAHDGGAGVTYRHAMTHDLVRAGETFDIVLSNHLLHHLTDDELQAVLRDSVSLVEPGGIVSHHDIARSRAAHSLYTAATWPFSGNLLADSFIREDGRLSIRRSYTVAELAATAPEGWTARGHVPFRVELRWQAGARASE